MEYDVPAGFVPVYRVRLQPQDSVEVQYFDGTKSPIHIVLTLRDHLSLERSQQIHPEGATLGVDINQQMAIEIYRQIGKLARTMGWPLPKEDEDKV